MKIYSEDNKTHIVNVVTMVYRKDFIYRNIIVKSFWKYLVLKNDYIEVFIIWQYISTYV